MAGLYQKKYAIRSKFYEIVRQREIELGKRLSIKDIKEQTGLSRNTISSWLSHELFGRIDSDSAITLKRWANCSWEDLLEEVVLD